MGVAAWTVARGLGGHTSYVTGRDYLVNLHNELQPVQLRPTPTYKGGRMKFYRDGFIGIVEDHCEGRWAKRTDAELTAENQALRAKLNILEA